MVFRMPLPSPSRPRQLLLCLVAGGGGALGHCARRRPGGRAQDMRFVGGMVRKSTPVIHNPPYVRRRQGGPGGPSLNKATAYAWLARLWSRELARRFARHAARRYWLAGSGRSSSSLLKKTCLFTQGAALVGWWG